MDKEQLSQIVKDAVAKVNETKKALIDYITRLLDDKGEDGFLITSLEVNGETFERSTYHIIARDGNGDINAYGSYDDGHDTYYEDDGMLEAPIDSFYIDELLNIILFNHDYDSEEISKKTHITEKTLESILRNDSKLKEDLKIDVSVPKIVDDSDEEVLRSYLYWKNPELFE